VIRSNNARSIGIIPDHLRSVELPSSEGMTLHVVADMHTRKRMMFEQCDAICILPGGLGTLDETFEIITWRQLGLHNKPIILANIEGYWQGFLDLVDQVIDNGFARPGAKELFTVVDQVEAVIPTAQADLPDDTDPRAADKTHLI
ncbi:MAG: TIGR00730 family Rossman fold protein, partial [Rhodospirillaceae bacterium]